MLRLLVLLSASLVVHGFAPNALIELESVATCDPNCGGTKVEGEQCYGNQCQGNQAPVHIGAWALALLPDTRKS